MGFGQCELTRRTDIQQLFDTQAHLAQFYIVAHTNICPARLSAKTLHTRVQAAKQDLRHTLNVLAAALHPNQSNLVRRKPHLYRPLALTTIEAINTAQAANTHYAFQHHIRQYPQAL